jgi:predicted O-methyltransferase YrrM
VNLFRGLSVVGFASALVALAPGCAGAEEADAGLDARVEKFLSQARDNWHDLNVPYADGQALFDLIVEHGFTRGLEIGTSTGHSTVWIAWAMSKTGGRVVTIEIDENRHRIALDNLRAAGLSEFVDARLANAHDLVPALAGPFDFVFSDADKDWYTQYFIDVDPRLVPGGCFTAHNVLQGMAGIDEFLEHVRGLEQYDTTIDRSSSSGISISCKKR